MIWAAKAPVRQAFSPVNIIRELLLSVSIMRLPLPRKWPPFFLSSEGQKERESSCVLMQDKCTDYNASHVVYICTFRTDPSKGTHRYAPPLSTVRGD